MHFGIELVEPGKILVRDQRLLHAKIAAQLGELRIGDDLCDAFHRLKLQRFTQKRSFADLLHRKARHEGPGLRHDIHEPLCRQPGHRL